jgi:hypothetical protein
MHRNTPFLHVLLHGLLHGLRAWVEGMGREIPPFGAVSAVLMSGGNGKREGNYAPRSQLDSQRRFLCDVSHLLCERDQIARSVINQPSEKHFAPPRERPQLANHREGRDERQKIPYPSHLITLESRETGESVNLYQIATE